ncbi:hypothetical protein KMW28_04580 [Flammeovirga yaeyamensis]|uniref:TonB C-terminal domain-containing protein n=1 Tax=Flammeovirga yaeyamensis TaxID=367791 RepID=A0AAX1N5W1_9BACT|nr:hypothetical protein [Flammeovirga yaeyamensis]MBB3697433.1 hypothetical protein [Flammeovirga yaeyamensis]NMF36127.1 hypothetical protein [Flammeovirga yaeyamensis]QWG02860.1 hypothetical protein KMW28_04580 [Flammeovirga yaeyamensis]
MKHQKTITTVLGYLLFITTSVFGQEKMYLNKWKAECQKSEAEFYQTIENVGTETPLYQIKTFSIDGVLLTNGLKEDVKKGRYINEFKEYYKNGNVSRIYHYKKSEKDVFVETFFPEGQKRSELILIGGYDEEKFLNAWNEEGEQICTNGEGEYFWKSEKNGKLYGGKMTKFHKIGEWTGYVEDLDITFTDTYRADGSLQKGQAVRQSDKKVFTYKDEYVYPYVLNYVLYKKVKSKINNLPKDINSDHVYISVYINKDGEGEYAKMRFTDEPTSESERQALAIVRKYLKKFNFEPTKNRGVATDGKAYFKFKLKKS